MPAGILTERDLARFLERVDGEVEGYQVRDVMSASVVTIPENEDLFAAYSLMCGKNIRHLVVVDDQGRAVGIKTFSDLMRRLGEEYLSEIKTVGEVMTRDVLAVLPDQTVREALRIMGQRCVSCVLVVEGDVPVGILTERDLTRLVFFSIARPGARMVSEGHEPRRSPPTGSGMSTPSRPWPGMERPRGSGTRPCSTRAGRLLGLITQTESRGRPGSGGTPSWREFMVPQAQPASWSAKNEGNSNIPTSSAEFLDEIEGSGLF
jgi:CBS domain-containing protein